MKRFLWISLALIVMAAIAVLGVRSYLQSARVAQEVTERLSDLYGGRLQFESVDIGVQTTTIRDLAFYEEGADNETPWLTLPSLTADVTLAQLISGNTLPASMTANDAVLLLRIGEDGELLTRLPTLPTVNGTEAMRLAELPIMVIERAKIIFRKTGAGDLVAYDVRLETKREKDMLNLSGTGQSKEFGPITITGKLQEKSRLLEFKLQTQSKPHVTQEILNRVPFIPSAILREVQIVKGDAPAEVHVRYDLQKNALSYRVELEPENMTLTIPSIDLKAEKARGKVKVEDQRVELRDFQVHAFEGTIRTQGDFDFGADRSVLRFPRIEVDDLKLADLPELWSIPAFVRKSRPHGRLSGSANLKVVMTPTSPALPAIAALIAGLTQPETVSAILAHWATLPTLDIDVKSQGKGKVRNPDNEKEVLEFDWQLAPRPRQAKGSMGAELLTLLTALSVPTAAIDDDVSIRVSTPNAGTKKAPQYFDFNFTLKNAKLSELAKNFEWDLPFPLEGEASLQIKASIPTDQLNDFNKYKAHGSIQIVNLRFLGLALDELEADLVYENGALELKSLKGSLASKDEKGTLTGSGKLQAFPPGEFRADLNLDRIPLARLMPTEPDRIKGTFSGKLHVQAPADKLDVIDAYEGEGSLNSDKLILFGQNIEQIISKFKLTKGRLQLQDLRARLDGAAFQGSAEARLEQAIPFEANLHLKDWNLAALQKLAGGDNLKQSAIAGTFSSTAKITGKLNPFLAKAQGQAQASDIAFEGFQATATKFDWETDGTKLQLSKLDAKLYGGNVAGTALVPFDTKEAAKVDLRMENIEAKQLAKQLRVPFAIEGSLSGTVQGTLDSADPKKARTGKLDLDLHAKALRVQKIPTQKLRGTVRYQEGAFDYKLEGSSLGGTFELEGQIPTQEKPAKKDNVNKGRLSLQGVRLQRLAQALGIPVNESLRGAIYLDLPFTHEAGETIPTGQGTLRITGVRWKDGTISELLRGEVAISPQQLRLRNFGGPLADGTVNAQFAYDFRQPKRSWLVIAIDNAETSKLLAPWLDGKIEGPLQARIRGNFADGWRGSAELELTRGKLVGFDISQWRLPATWSYSPSQNRGQISIAETTAQVARGRATGKLTLHLETAIRVEGGVRFSNVDVQEFLRQTIGPSQIGGGKMTGRIDFGGDQVRSLDDLRADIDLSFSQAQALQLPVLKQIAPFLGVGATTTFQKGKLIAKASRGVVRVQHLSLEGNNVQVYADGNVTLEGRLNLDVLAKTRDFGLPTDRLRVLGLRVPIAGPVPLVVIMEVSELLSNRLIYLQVTGTPQSPVIRLRPVPILAQEAIRFFLNRYNIPISTLP